MSTLLYLKWITNKDLLYSTWNSVQRYVAAWMGGEFAGRMDACICMAESLRCSPETITTLFIGCQSVQFSSSVLFDSLQPHGLQHTRRPCPSPTLGACSNSCAWSRWWHPTILSSVIPFSSCLQSFPARDLFHESALHIRWPKYWSFSFSISPSNEHSELISFRMDWLDLLAVQGTLKSLLPNTK